MKFFFLLFTVLLAIPVIWPSVDLWVSGLFYRAGDGFFLADHPLFVGLHGFAYYGARVFGLTFVVLAITAFLRKRMVAGIDAKAWFFLFVALVVAPGLVANAGLKDHWGRERPREVTEFGGNGVFTPALSPQFRNAHTNGSFVSGDGAFGFFLPVFAYVVPRRLSRRFFWGGMAAGGVFGFVRIAMGAHFFSDVVYAAFTMLVTVAAVHAAFYGRRMTVSLWRSWFVAAS